MNNNASSSPGAKVDTKIGPMEICIRSDRKNSMIPGGKMIPKVPAAATEPIE